jgi:hypothetical protein
MSIDLSKLSDEELTALANNDFSKLSSATLTLLSGETPPEPKRSVSEQVSRGLGLAGRAAVEGLSSPVTAAADFMSGAYNFGANLAGSTSRLPYMSREQSAALTREGLPVPENKLERAVQSGMTGMMSTTGFARAAPGTILATDMARQIPASAGMGVTAQPTAEFVKDRTGSDFAATLAGLGVGVIAGKYTGDLAGKLTTPTVPVVTMRDVQDRAQRAYTAVDNLGITLTPQSSTGIVQRINTNLTNSRYLPENAPQIATVLREFDQILARGPITFGTLDKMRALANDLKTNSDANVRRLSGNIVGTVDDFVAGLSPNNVSSGAGGVDEAVRTIMSARREWRNLSRATTIENIMDTAEIKALNPSASESELLRKGFMALAADKSKMKFFTVDEQNAIKAVAKGSSLDPLLSLAARFNPQRSQLVGAGTFAGAVVKPELAIPVAAVGFSADKLQNFLRRRDAEGVMSGLLSGSTQPRLPTTSLRSLLSGAVNPPLD